jgi:hypothetical protein
MNTIFTLTSNRPLGDTIPWLEQNIGPTIWYYGGAYSDPGSWHIYQWLATMLGQLTDTIESNDIHDISYRSGFGWRSFICIPRYKLNPKDMKTYLVVDIDDTALAVQFKLSFQ